MSSLSPALYGADGNCVLCLFCGCTYSGIVAILLYCPITRCEPQAVCANASTPTVLYIGTMSVVGQVSILESMATSV